MARTSEDREHLRPIAEPRELHPETERLVEDYPQEGERVVLRGPVRVFIGPDDRTRIPIHLIQSHDPPIKVQFNPRGRPVVPVIRIIPTIDPRTQDPAVDAPLVEVRNRRESQTLKRLRSPTREQEARR